MPTTRNFSSAAAFKKNMAYVHMHIHAGPSKNPYPVKIRGKSHTVIHAKRGTTKSSHPSYKK